MTDERTLARWRLVLGRFAQPELGDALGLPGNELHRMDAALEFLYGREYQGRCVRPAPGGGSGQGGRASAGLALPDWVGEVRDLFPRKTVEILERHALDRYQLNELLTDPRTLERLEPGYDLLKALLIFRDRLQGQVVPLARRIIRSVIEDLTRRLSREIRRALWGRLNRRRRTPVRTRALDFARTVKANLKGWDPTRRRLALLERIHCFARTRRYLPWHIVMAVDQSGSMVDSVIHSAVTASILAGLPSVRVSLVAFDTRLVDLTPHVHDAVEVLMSVQLGGGTDIGGAVEYCEGLVQHPSRTVLVVVTDFCEGSRPGRLLSAIHRLRGGGVRVLGLAALDREANPSYDQSMAQKCTDAGMEVAALTPEGLADWLAGILLT